MEHNIIHKISVETYLDDKFTIYYHNILIKINLVSIFIFQDNIYLLIFI